MKFAFAALLAALVIAQPSFGGDKKKLTEAECQAKRTKLAELQEADLATLKIDEATRQKMVDKEQMEISVKCPSGPH